MTIDHHNTYLFALVDGGGTVPPELGAVRRLVDRGHHVTVLGEDAMRADALATGADFRPWLAAPNKASRRPQDDRYQDWACSNPFQLMPLLLEKQFVGPAEGYATDVRTAAAELHPDLVVCSFFAYGAMIGAESMGIPFDVLLPNAYLFPARGMPAFGLGAQPARGPLGRLRDRLANAMAGRLWDKRMPELNGLRKKLGLGPIDHFFDQVDGARRHLVLTSKAFDFPAELPDHVRYVGAVLDDPAWATAARWTPPPGDDPLVLVALSSTFQDQAACLQRIVDALGTLAVRGVVTTGPALDPASLEAPANVTVVPAAPHSEVLRQAAAVITHGGHGTVVRALAADVPMAVLHHGRDQADNAARVVARGAGVSVKRTAPPATIAATVRRLLDEPSFRSGAAQLGAAIREDAAAPALVAELEDLPLKARS